MNKFRFFHPLLWLFLGYALWMFIPPFFTDKGHHLPTVFADLVGLGALCCGYVITAGMKSERLGNWKIGFDMERTGILLVAFAGLIYGIRFLLFLDVGIYAFLHPYSRDSSLIDTVCQVLTTPYIIFVMTVFHLTRKRRYLLLLVLEVVLFIIPTMARSYYVMFPLYYFFIRLYYSDFDLRREVRLFAPVLLVAVVFIAAFGNYINAVRSYATIGKIEQGLDLEVSSIERNAIEFIINRLNIHGESFQIEPVIKKAVELDRISFDSMIGRWFGGVSGYSIHPTEVSNLTGLLIGYGEKTSTDFPRNFILSNYPWPVTALLFFNLILGGALAFTYKVFFVRNSPLFMMIWVPFVFSVAFAGQGAFPSTFVFQYVFLWASFFVLMLCYLAVRVVYGFAVIVHKEFRFGLRRSIAQAQ